jgi:hypothetical protein
MADQDTGLQADHQLLDCGRRRKLSNHRQGRPKVCPHNPLQVCQQ